MILKDIIFILFPEYKFFSIFRAKHIRLFNIRQQILQGLGMTEQPNFTTPVRPDLHLLTDIGSNHWVDDVFDDKVKVIHRGGDDYLAKSVQALAPSCKCFLKPFPQ